MVTTQVTVTAMTVVEVERVVVVGP
jgi:hypothetical protein